MNRQQRVGTAYWFFSGLIDICLSYVMWFVTDEKNNPTFVVDENAHISYPVLDIIKSDSQVLDSEASLV